MGWDEIFKKTGLKIRATFLLGEKPHQCNFCNKEFKRYSTYFVHMRRFHCDDDKKPHHCTEWQKGVCYQRRLGISRAITHRKNADENKTDVAQSIPAVRKFDFFG